MRVALVKRRISLTHGGSERYCVHLARGLRARGHDVTVIGHRIDEGLRRELPFVPVRINPAASWTKNRSFARNAGLAARSGRYDVVYGLARSHGTDVVQVMERLQAHWVEAYYSPFVRRLQKWNPRHRTLIDLERAIYTADTTLRIVTQSDVDRRLLHRYYGVPDERIRVIPNGADLERFRPELREEGNAVRREFGIPLDVPLLAFAAHDFVRKGLRTVFAAMTRSTIPDVHLLVVGGGSIPRFQRLSRRMGLFQRIRFTGPRPDAPRLFAAADLFVLPTLYEPFPTVVVEAMACGTPVVTLPTSGAADLVAIGETGYLPAVESAAAGIAVGIDRHFRATTAERARMSAAAIERVRSHTFERVVAETDALLHEVWAARDTPAVAA